MVDFHRQISENGIMDATHLPDMADIIGTLQAHRQELEADGIEHLSVFGSVARGQSKPGSDVDICVELKEASRPRGYGMIAHIEALRERLRGVLGRPVDLVVSPVYKARLREQIEKDSLRAF